MGIIKWKWIGSGTKTNDLTVDVRSFTQSLGRNWEQEWLIAHADGARLTKAPLLRRRKRGHNEFFVVGNRRASVYVSDEGPDFNLYLLENRKHCWEVITNLLPSLPYSTSVVYFASSLTAAFTSETESIHDRAFRLFERTDWTQTIYKRTPFTLLYFKRLIISPVWSTLSYSYRFPIGPLSLIRVTRRRWISHRYLANRLPAYTY